MAADQTSNPGGEPHLGPTVAHVDLSAISDNLAAIKSAAAPAAVMPIVKANAYGHGLVQVAMHLQNVDVRHLGVAHLTEGIELRLAGIECDILVLGGLMVNQIPSLIEHRLAITASSVDHLRQIDQAAASLKKRASVHLKIDTGMGRIGTHHKSADRLFRASLNSSHIEVEGVFSHFATSDEADLSWSKTQLARFEEALDFYPANGLDTPPRHISNSGGILQLPEANLDMVRPGILLYGVYPSREAIRSIEVRPALSWTARVAFSKMLEADEPVSYGSTWKSAKATRIATIPVGYGDGYFRLLSNTAQVVINGRRYPIVGRVCMDQFMVDLGDDPLGRHDEVVLLGGPEQVAITAQDLATLAQTIPYEVLTNINARVPRIYHG